MVRNNYETTYRYPDKMLTDIFAYRYADVSLWEEFTESDRRFLVQGFQIISDQLFPYWKNKKEDPTAKAKWRAIHDKLCRELGLEELSQTAYWYKTTSQGKPLPGLLRPVCLQCLDGDGGQCAVYRFRRRQAVFWQADGGPTGKIRYQADRL
jgi:hypothetical protein